MAFACDPDAAPVPPAVLCERYGFDVAYVRDCALANGLSARLGSNHGLHMGETRLFRSSGSMMDEGYVSWKVYQQEDRPEAYPAYLERAAKSMMACERHDAVASEAAPETPLNLTFGAAVPISSAQHVRELVQVVNDAAREYPVVVVTQRYDGSPTVLDLEQLSSALDGFGYVAVLTLPELAWDFNALVHLPVYNGAARLYPAGAFGLDLQDAERYLYRAPGEHEGKRTVSRIVNDTIGCAAKAYGSSVGVADAVRKTVTVGGVYPDAMRAICFKPNCTVATAELADVLGLAELPVDRAFRKGMVLEGVVDAKTGLLCGYTEGTLTSPEEALTSYAAGSTVLVRVASVADDACDVDLFPGVRVRIEAADVLDEGTSPAQVLVEGQVVTAYVAERAQGGEPWLLSIREAGVDILPAPSLLKGGPAWLAPEDAERVEHLEDVLERTYGVEAAIAASEAPVPRDAGPRAENAIRYLYAQSRSLELENSGLREEARRMQGELDEAKSERLDRGRRDAGSKRYRLPRGIQFADADERRGFEEMDMDYRLQVAWYEQIIPAERDERGLSGSWGYGEDFFSSLGETDVELSKALRCMVDVLLGERLDCRKTHQLRTGMGGDDPACKLADGRNVFRCAIEQNTPQAARLHFCRAADGTVTFLSVRRHDDMRA